MVKSKNLFRPVWKSCLGQLTAWFRHNSHADYLALLFSLAGILIAYGVATNIFEQMPHIEDEVAYVWQANVVASGRLTIPSPAYEKSFLAPFVVDYQGSRFGKYPIGWPALLGLAVRLNMRAWINPLLAGLAVWLTYCLGKRIFNEKAGLLAAGLTLSSPFFMMNSGNLLSHPLSLVLSAAFVLAWLDAFAGNPPQHPRLSILVAALSLGLLAITRPFTAVAISVPFAIHGIYLLWHGNRQIRLSLFAFGILALLVSSVHLLWQYAATGDPLLNTYTLWWPYDKVGFGPGHGHTQDGHSFHYAYINTRHSLRVGTSDLFGWPGYSWIFLPFGLWAARHNKRALLIASVFPCCVIVYLAYWTQPYLFGPRYFYESLYSLTIISAAGILWLGGWLGQAAGLPRTELQNVRSLVTVGLLTGLIGLNLLVYAPMRLGGLVNLFGIGRENLLPFQSAAAQELTPALVFVHTPHWQKYSSTFELEDPDLTTPFIFAWSRGPQTDTAVAALYPERSIFHYYPEEPYRLYTAPLANKE